MTRTKERQQENFCLDEIKKLLIWVLTHFTFQLFEQNNIDRCRQAPLLINHV